MTGKLSLVSPQKQTTIRISTELYELVEAEAARMSVSVSAYIRESLIARVAWSAGRRGDTSVIDAIRKVWPDPPLF